MKKSLILHIDGRGPSAPKRKSKRPTTDTNLAARPTKTNLNIDPSPKVKTPRLNKQPKDTASMAYRNKNLSALSAALLNTLSCLSTLDISHNKLTDLQIELLMNSCPKLQSLCIQDNLSTLIPASIWKLKNLEKFRHDWIKLFPDQSYETADNLKNIKILIRKPSMVMKNHGVVGMNFQCYCTQILKIEIDSSLEEKVEQSKCSQFSQSLMLDSIRLKTKTDNKQSKTEIQVIENAKRQPAPPIIAGCFAMCGFGLQRQKKPKEQKWRQLPSKKENKDAHGEGKGQQISSSNIQIQKIRQIRQTQKTNYTSNAHSEIPEMTYPHQDMPLHLFFSKFDNNPNAEVEIDRLLLKGYNPNTYDGNGLSPYHIIVIFRQEKALERLMNITFKNPGFFDLEMPSMKDGRNILHFSVFLKDYSFTKALIDFGLPIDKRDFNGARLIHLVDQNYEFLLLLRKTLRKKLKQQNQPSFINKPQPMRRKYCRHMPRVTKQSNYHVVQNQNLNLMSMYEAAVDINAPRT